jgi:hypothetical protein
MSRINHIQLPQLLDIESIGLHPTIQQHNDAKYDDVLKYKTRILAGYGKIYESICSERLDIIGNKR